MEFASKGVGAAGLTTGVIGTALGALNSGLFNGNGILGGGWNNGCNPSGIPVNRYEAEQQARIAALETEVKLRDANIYTDGKLLDLYKYFDGEIKRVDARLCAQETYNATNTATINCMAGQIAQLMSLTKLVIPNGSVCPGWGNVTVTPAAAPTT